MLRFLLPLLLVFACGDAAPSASDTSSTGSTPECEGSGTKDCPTTGACMDGVCFALECVDDAGCASDEFCYGNDCLPKVDVGKPCETGAHECKTGICGTVADELQCVEGCAFRTCWDGPTVDALPCAEVEGQCAEPCVWKTLPGWLACAPGFICVGGGALGAENGHYCWPEGSGDFGMPGDSCFGEKNDNCATKLCEFDVCQWPCIGLPPQCPPGTTCGFSYCE